MYILLKDHLSRIYAKLLWGAKNNLGTLTLSFIYMLKKLITALTG